MNETRLVARVADAAWLSVPELIVAHARRTPDAVAIRQWSEVVTYRELLSRAAALAAALRERGAGPETRVGVCAGRQPATVVALLGIWLAGAAYVPIDLGNPRPRCRAIAADAGLELVVADAAGRRRLGSDGYHYLDLPGPDSSAGDGDVVSVPEPHPESVAYVMYTSGPTGAPKGVLTTHRNLATWVAGCADWVPGVGPAMRALALHSMAFDASCYDLLVPLAAGGAVQLAGEEDRGDPARLRQFLAEHRVTWAAVPPAIAGLLDPAAAPDLAVLIVGGELEASELVERWTGTSRCRFFHAYGLTEATVVQVATELRGRWGGPLPLGWALPGQRLHVLDAHGDPVVAEGQEGELCVAGTGVARGYLDRPDLTAERFVPEPGAAHPGARMYRTGDIVRRLPGGALAFVGRRDGLVRVRGQRVEVSEVEATLRQHPSVANATVVPTVVRQATELVGFLAPADADPPDPSSVREFVSGLLPAAMVPRHLEWLPQLPLTLSGKVDRITLGARAARLAGRGGQPYRAVVGRGTGVRPSDPPAAGPVAALWRRTLGGPAPGPEADFFAAGGHSVDAMRLVAAIRDELGRDISTVDVFTARTLAELTRRVAAAPSLTASKVRLAWDATVASVKRGRREKVGTAAGVRARATARVRPPVAPVVVLNHPILTGHREGSVYGTIGPDSHWVLDQHRIGGVAVLPGTAHLECAREAVTRLLTGRGHGAVVELREVSLLDPLAVPDGDASRYWIAYGGGGGFQVTSDHETAGQTGTRRRVHARFQGGWVTPTPAPPVDLAAVRQRCQPVSARCGGSVVAYGGRWDCLRETYAGSGEALALIEAPAEAVADLDRWVLHPALLDSATSLGFVRADGSYLPLAYGRVVVRNRLPARFYSHVRYHDLSSTGPLSAAVTLCDGEGNVLVEITDVTLRRIDGRVGDPDERAPHVPVVSSG